jgi:hypothetical protein
VEEIKVVFAPARGGLYRAVRIESDDADVQGHFRVARYVSLEPEPSGEETLYRIAVDGDDVRLIFEPVGHYRSHRVAQPSEHDRA